MNNITEQATFSKNPFFIIIYGEGKTKYNIPYFHLFIQNLGEFKIKIPIKNINTITIDDLIEIDDSNILPNKIKKQLLTFLLSKYELSIDDKTNIESMAELWNGINKYNPTANIITLNQLKKFRE